MPLCEYMLIQWALPRELFGPSSGNTERESGRILMVTELAPNSRQVDGPSRSRARWDEPATSGLGKGVYRKSPSRAWRVTDGSLVPAADLRLSRWRKFITSFMDNQITHVVTKRKKKRMPRGRMDTIFQKKTIKYGACKTGFDECLTGSQVQIRSVCKPHV